MDEIHLADLGLRTLKILVEREPVVIDGTALEAKSSDRLNFTDFLLKCDLDDYVFFVPSPIACKYPLADIALEGKAAYEVTFSADGSLGSRLYGVHTSDKVRNVVNAAKASNVHRLSVSALHCAATIAAASNKVMHTVSKSLADCETVHRALVSNGLKKVKPNAQESLWTTLRGAT